MNFLVDSLKEPTERTISKKVFADFIKQFYKKEKEIDKLFIYYFENIYINMLLYQNYTSYHKLNHTKYILYITMGDRGPNLF